MKTLVLRNNDNSVQVEYLTDLIGNNDALTIYQIRDLNATGTGTVTLGATAIGLGMDFGAEPKTLKQFIAFAITNNLILEVYETGQAVKTAVYYGGAIGGEFL
jgi:hypothetical protein